VWDGNWTADCFVCFGWNAPSEDMLLVLVNFAPNQSQCYVHIPFNYLGGGRVLLEDLMGPEIYERNGEELVGRGLYLDVRPWGFHVFRLKALR
jgi:hypothetical protein